MEHGSFFVAERIMLTSSVVLQETSELFQDEVQHCKSLYVIIRKGLWSHLSPGFEWLWNKSSLLKTTLRADWVKCIMKLLHCTIVRRSWVRGASWQVQQQTVAAFETILIDVLEAWIATRWLVLGTLKSFHHPVFSFWLISYWNGFPSHSIPKLSFFSDMGLDFDLVKIIKFYTVLSSA